MTVAEGRAGAPLEPLPVAIGRVVEGTGEAVAVADAGGACASSVTVALGTLDGNGTTTDASGRTPEADDEGCAVEDGTPELTR